MVKKGVRKIHELTHDAERLNSILVENFVNLQKSMTNLAIKFDSMADQMTKLLSLFELSARSFTEKLNTTVPELEKDREFLDKLNKLLDQNKVIAKGLTMMEEKIREKVYGPQPLPPKQFSPRGYLPSMTEEQNV
jgi:lipid II:glycine glycyltransferase (peptidoglycan interpeptide bridge formation enzyme)